MTTKSQRAVPVMAVALRAIILGLGLLHVPPRVRAHAHLGLAHPGLCGQWAGRATVKTSSLCWVAIEPMAVTVEPDAANAVIW